MRLLKIILSKIQREKFSEASGSSNDDFPGMPAEIKAAHQYSIRHKTQLLDSESCGCFYCCAIFPPSAITQWIDEASGGQTALCPHCGIDSVIGDRSGFPISAEFLAQMKQHWFYSQIT